MAIIKPLFSGWHGGISGPSFYIKLSGERLIGTQISGLFNWQSLMLAMMNTALGPGGTRSVTFDSKFRIMLAASASFSIDNTATVGATNAVPYLGFTQTMPLAAVNDSATYGASTPWGMTATLPILGVFNPELPPKEDSILESMRPNSTTGRSLNGYTVNIEEPTLYNRRWKFGDLGLEKTFTKYATAAGDRSLQEFLETVSRFRYWPDATVPATYEDWVVSQDSKQKFQPDRQYVRKALFTHDLMGWKL